MNVHRREHSVQQGCSMISMYELLRREDDYRLHMLVVVSEREGEENEWID